MIMKNFIFDLDGTLLNTLEDIGNACNMVLRQNGFTLHEMSAYRRMVGNGFDVLVQRALPKNHALNPDEVASVTSEAKNYYFNHLYERTKPYPGIPELLESLVAQGKNLAVLSNKPDPMTREIMEHFFPAIPFAKVQGALPGVPLKPSPISLLKIMGDNGWLARDSCYVGDSEVDVRTGKNAQVKTAAVTWGFRDAEELEREKPDLLFRHPQDLALS